MMNFVVLKVVNEKDYEEFAGIQPKNAKDIQALSKCVVKIRDHFEYFSVSASWMCYDSFSPYYKGDSLDLYADDHGVKSSSSSYESVFGWRTYSWTDNCHWRLKCFGLGTTDFYVGIQQSNNDVKQLCNHYFCKSSTSFAFSPYHGQLYSNNSWKDKYPSNKQPLICKNDGKDIIDIYLENGQLSFGINGKKAEKIAFTLPQVNDLKFALSFKGSTRKFEIISSIKY